MDARDVVADLTAESDELDALVATFPTGRLGPADARGRVDHRASDRPPGLDRPGRSHGDHRPGRVHGAPAGSDRPTESPLWTEAPRSSSTSRSHLLARWRDGRAALAQALLGLPSGEKVLWYGTAMSPASMATARIMETWAHGLDVADALGVHREPTARLRNIAHLGHRTLGFSFLAHGRELPTQPVRLELTAPDGTLWTFGPGGRHQPGHRSRRWTSVCW